MRDEYQINNLNPRKNPYICEIDKQDLTAAPPEFEPERQYYFIKKCRELIKKRSAELNRPMNACIVTFGCQMNARDSEKILGILKEVGFEETDDETGADFVLFNTCTVRDNANQRVYGRLGVLKPYKTKNPDMKIGLCGCMMQEKSVIEKIQKSYNFVDLVFGTHNIFKFAELLYIMYSRDTQDSVIPAQNINDKTTNSVKTIESDSAENKKSNIYDTTDKNKNAEKKQSAPIIDIWDGTDQIVEDLPCERKYPFKSGVNIMFGCNNFCTYCIVPYVRGRERSRRSGEILDEIKRLAEDGVKEIMLLGQNVNSYGTGLENELSFPELLKEAEKIDGIERIRFMTSHPKDLSDELIDVIKNSDKICRHIHLPLQSGSTKILEAMNRRYTKESYIALANKIRIEIPDIAITTDIIVGFPGETKEDIDDTIDVINTVEFDGAFTFVYSKRTGTKAAAMGNQVTEDFVKEHFDRVLTTVQDNAKKRARLKTGNTEKVLVECVNDHDSTMLTGRLSNNLCVHFEGDQSLIGKIVNVKLDECKDFYYVGQQVH